MYAELRRSARPYTLRATREKLQGCTGRTNGQNSQQPGNEKVKNLNLPGDRGLSKFLFYTTMRAAGPLSSFYTKTRLTCSGNTYFFASTARISVIDGRFL